MIDQRDAHDGRTVPDEAIAGWFGKLSCLGDFASRRLPADWVKACDAWLCNGMQASRLALGEQWLGHYLEAPVWRFACAPGVLDPSWWFGVLMPSCDQVGRYFPLVLAKAAAAPPGSASGFDALEAWWAHLAECGLQTLADGATIGGLEAALAVAPRWAADAPDGIAGASAQARHPDLTAQSAPPSQAGEEALVHHVGVDFLRHAACAAQQGRLVGRSLWWPVVHARALTVGTMVAGLPPASAFAAMLSGRW